MKRKYIGSRRMGSGGGIGKSKGVWRSGARRYPYLAICVCNDGNEASLERGKAYRVIKPLATDPPERVRVIDEEHEDYLYRAEWFVRIEVPEGARKSVLKAVSK
jgi:hypothetical protein